jgi:nucleoside-diphosphate-sugar epimerase
MRVLVVGASGVIGTRLVPRLRQRGHEVTGTSRAPGDHPARVADRFCVTRALRARYPPSAILSCAPKAREDGS